jgi:Tfp pilus assembly protein FimT
MIQIVVTLAVVSTLAVVALPTTTNALKNYRLNAAVAAATGAIQATRYRAIMHAYPYQITFNSADGTYQVAKRPPGSGFESVGSKVPLPGAGDVTINQTTTLQFNANGTVSTTAGTMSFTISDPLILKMRTITLTGGGDVSVTQTTSSPSSPGLYPTGNPGGAGSSDGGGSGNGDTCGALPSH